MINNRKSYLHLLLEQTGQRVDAGDGILIAQHALRVEVVRHHFLIVESQRRQRGNRSTASTPEEVPADSDTPQKKTVHRTSIRGFE